MSERDPQILEPHLDLILSGELAVRSSREHILRCLYVIRRRYNDPFQSGRGREGDIRNRQPETFPGMLRGFTYSQRWTEASQKARVEAGIAYLAPLVGDTVGDYPPIPYPAGPGGDRIDQMGNFIPTGLP